MEIFIDLAELSENQSEPTIPGIDLNLSGLVSPVSEQGQLGVMQTQLKTTPELSLPGFDPSLYFSQIQAEFDKIKSAQDSFSVKDDVKTFQAAQQNSNTALDPLASYLEQRFNKIETIATNNSELRELIQGTSDNRLTEIQSIISKPLNQETAIEKESSVSAISDVLTNLINTVSGGDSLVQTTQTGPTVTNNQLVNTAESTIDLTTQNISNLSETISNFATNLVNGVSAQPAIALNQETSPALLDPTKKQLAITAEAVRPDFGAASLTALRQMAESTQTMSTAPGILNNNTSQSNTTVMQADSSPTQPQVQPMSEPQPGSVIMTGGQGDTSSIYMMQILNLMKSGQIKVKIH
jgi:hypothetical protein